jgi:hypothetical protein
LPGFFQRKPARNGWFSFLFSQLDDHEIVP